MPILDSKLIVGIDQPSNSFTNAFNLTQKAVVHEKLLIINDIMKKLKLYEYSYDQVFFIKNLIRKSF